MGKKVLRGILERLECLETAPSLNDLGDTLGSARTEIVALRAAEDATKTQVDLLEQKFHVLEMAVGDGIERVDRTERRIQNSVKRARQKFKESGHVDEGLEAENAELQLSDGTRGEEQGMPAVREAMAAAPEEPSTIPGVTLEAIKEFRGMT